MQYLRARYYDVASGTFNRLDPFAGNMQDPQSLHKYLYVHGDPVQGIDPMGQWTLGNSMMTGAIIGAIGGFSYGAYRGFQRGVRETGTIWSVRSWAYGMGYGLAGSAVGAVAGASIAGLAHVAVTYLASLPTAAIPGNLLFDLVGGVHSTVVIAFAAGVAAGLGFGIVAPASTASAVAALGSGGLTAFAGALDSLLIANKAKLPTTLYDWYTLKTLWQRNVNGNLRPVTAHGIVRTTFVWGIAFASGFAVGFAIGGTTRLTTDALIDEIETLI